jgi:hypothetical protein
MITGQKWLMLAFTCVSLGAGPLAARADSPTFEFTPFVGGRLGGGFDVDNGDGTKSSVDLGAGVSYGLDLGLYRDAQGFYEALYSTQQTNLDSNDPALRNLDIDVDYLQIGGTALFEQDERFVPYVSFTIGAAFLEPKQGGYSSETKFAMSLGTGLRIPFNERISAMLGVRGYLTFIESNTSLFCTSTPAGSQCLVKSSGSALFQGEGQLGLTVRF